MRASWTRIGALAAALLTTVVARADDGAAFTVSNEAEGNRVISFSRAHDGSLVEASSYATGGKGTGASLQSQGALALSEDGRYLVVVDAGSNELSSFAVRGSKLSLRSRVPSNGVRPVSVAVDRDLVYVVNAGAPSNISGYELDHLGRLRALPGSVRPLSRADAGPGQIAFSADGRSLVVTERTTNKLLAYPLDRHGRAGAPRVYDSAGGTPFGFAIRRAGELFVSEASTLSLSSYDLDRRAGLEPISKVVASGERAPCWVALSRDQRTAFVANAGSASISSYTVARSGAVTLAAAKAGDGSAPQDLALDPRGDTLYLLDRGNAGIVRFNAHEPNKLEYVDLVGELPAFASGLVVH